MKTRDDEILSAVRQMASGRFKATAIKVELEADFNRGHADRDACEYCDEGYNECLECYGAGNSDCSRCDGRGLAHCDDESCIGTEHDCDDCDGSGTISCDNGCDNGSFICDECNGDWRDGYDNDDSWSSERYCHEWLMEQLSGFGLAERKENEVFTVSHGFQTHWFPTGALKYAEFYRDGSVDSELTFTIALDNPENIYLLPKVIQLWNELGDAIGNGINVQGAGMHMALLQSVQYKYPVRTTETQQAPFSNFKHSMDLLLPALYFLGSGDDTSRGLRFRQPTVSRDDKYSAVYYSGGALEFRVFQTCYDNSDAILDNVVVMKNCLRYWTTAYRPSGVDKIAKELRFGVDTSDKLDRFYITHQHIDVLNAGLDRLKPSYYTTREIKQQRNFKVDKREINKTIQKVKHEAALGYTEYQDRFNRLDIHPFVPVAEQERLVAEVEQQVEQELAREPQLTIEQITQQKVEEYFSDRRCGQYLLIS